ncbi:MAG TPA: aldose 1-epimerase family protein [Firmicutes bacterium]|nr:aldose 1-epimerase family protein [Bacillota bacterium]
MDYLGKKYTKEELLQRIGCLGQIGGTRHYILDEGRSRGVRCIDCDTGSGLRFTVVADRGMDISLASYKGINLAYRTPIGEAHPAHYEPEGLGWLRTFFAGLLTTCGLTYLGQPGRDGDQELGLHGRHSCQPAVRLNDLSRFEGDDYIIDLTGIVEDAVLFGDKIRLTRNIRCKMGESSIHITDKAENFGYQSAPFTILYHVNPGFPLLDASARLYLTAASCEPCDEHSGQGMADRFSFSAPVQGFREMNWLYTMKGDEGGKAHALFANADLAGGLALHLAFNPGELPFFNEWKMLGQGEYVVGIEPCNSPCRNRAKVRAAGLLPMLEPGEERTTHLEIAVVEGADRIKQLANAIELV